MCEVFYEFLAGLKLRAVWVEDADLFEEGLGEEFVLDVCAVHLLHEGEDLDDLRVTLMFQQSLCEHEDEPHVLTIVEVDLPLTFLFTISCELQIRVDLLQGLKV